MKVSLNEISQFTEVTLSVDDLVARINQQLGGVENVLDLGSRYDGAVVVRVASCVPHDNADRLQVCLVDDGGVTHGVERTQDGYVQVVCGAPNVTEGMLAVWLPPGSIVPSSHADKEPFALDARELRGVVSNGMLASAKELALGDDHDGIVAIDPDEPNHTSVRIEPGASFATVFGLDDTVIDIENKMFTHRPDCFGQLGVAREIAGIQQKQFSSPEWYKAFSDNNRGDGLDLVVKNDASEKVSRFMVVALKDVTVGPSPLWLKAALARLGAKSINNIVDITNYVMLLTGQPLHAYDYDKLRGRTLIARHADEKESIQLLNGKTYELTSSDIVIADAEGPVGIAGVMGGGGSEVSETTKNIVLECATFDMYAIRRMSMRYGLFTDAVTRFNKGQSTHQNPYVLHRALDYITGISGGVLASNVFDIHGELPSNASIDISPAFINDRLGLALSAPDIQTLLRNVEFAVDVTNDMLSVTAPFWRTDIDIPEDIVEEVGRLYGFDKLPRVLPVRTIKPASTSPIVELKQSVRSAMQKIGANEVLTYSFVHQNILKRAEQDVSQAFQLSNALSPDLQFYRLSVLPSLLDKVHANVKAGHDEFVLYEIGKGHNKRHHLNDDEGLPSEMQFIDMVYASRKPQSGAPYYQVHALIVKMFKDLGVKQLVVKPVTEMYDYPVTAPFDLDRSALLETEDGVFLGMVGELKDTVTRSFKLPEYTAAATLDTLGVLKAVKNQTSQYTALTKFPKVTQDISLKISIETRYADLESIVRRTLMQSELSGDSVITVDPLSIYQPEGSSTKTITFHIEVASYSRTLTDTEISAVLDSVASIANSELGAERV